MKFKELERQIQVINIAYGKQLKVTNNGRSVCICDANGCYVIITNRVPYSLHVSDVNFERLLEDNLRYDLLKAVYEFAQTPIDSRNLFPKYRISSKLTPNDDCRFLLKDCGDIDSLVWGGRHYNNNTFTQKEIDYICEKFHTDLSDFDIDEVEQ